MPSPRFSARARRTSSSSTNRMALATNATRCARFSTLKSAPASFSHVSLISDVGERT